jgi:preprotein translocase subunit YajC
MNNLIPTIFAMGTGILGGGGAPAGEGQPGGGMGTLLLLFGMLALMYFILFLPEKRRRKKLEQAISALKQGDKVVTSGGIIGFVDFVGEKTIHLKTLKDTKLEIGKEFVISIIKEEGENK